MSLDTLYRIKEAFPAAILVVGCMAYAFFVLDAGFYSILIGPVLAMPVALFLVILAMYPVFCCIGCDSALKAFKTPPNIRRLVNIAVGTFVGTIVVIGVIYMYRRDWANMLPFPWCLAQAPFYGIKELLRLLG